MTLKRDVALPVRLAKDEGLCVRVCAPQDDSVLVIFSRLKASSEPTFVLNGLSQSYRPLGAQSVKKLLYQMRTTKISGALNSASSLSFVQKVGMVKRFV